MPVGDVRTDHRAAGRRGAATAAHDKGIVHRDARARRTSRSPATRHAKVLDFGLAKAAAATPDAATAAMHVAASGLMHGTARMHEPRAGARAQPLDKRTDIWSFGCVTYEALTGRHPFSAETLSDMTAAILGRDPDWSGLGSRAAGLRGLICYVLTRYLTGPVLRLRAAARRLAEGKLSARATRHSSTPRRDRRAGS